MVEVGDIFFHDGFDLRLREVLGGEIFEVGIYEGYQFALQLPHQLRP